MYDLNRLSQKLEALRSHFDHISSFTVTKSQEESAVLVFPNVTARVRDPEHRETLHQAALEKLQGLAHESMNHTHIVQRVPNETEVAECNALEFGSYAGLDSTLDHALATLKAPGADRGCRPQSGIVSGH